MKSTLYCIILSFMLTFTYWGFLFSLLLSIYPVGLSVNTGTADSRFLDTH